jgi:hypothetical protein
MNGGIINILSDVNFINYRLTSILFYLVIVLAVCKKETKALILEYSPLSYTVADLKKFSYSNFVTRFAQVIFSKAFCFKVVTYKM